jgi:hypothetical protein
LSGPDWYQTAAVRRWSWDDAGSAETVEGGAFFSPKLVTANQHAEVQAAGPALEGRLQLRHLFRYLAATETIELELVNPALTHIMRRTGLEDFVPQAYQIYTDEGFHAAMCLEMRQKLSGSARVPFMTRYHSASLSELFATIARLPTNERELALLTAASLNETLISASLRQAVDRSVVPLVRRAIAAHAADEAVHHAFFTRLFIAVWERLPHQRQSFLADLIPALCRALLKSDLKAVTQDLVAEGFSPQRAARIVEDLSGMTRDPALAPNTRGVEQMLRRCGAAEFESVREYLASLPSFHQREAVS